MYCMTTNETDADLSHSKEPSAIDETNPNYDKAEFTVIRRLVRYLPDGLASKHQVTRAAVAMFHFRIVLLLF